MEFGPSPPTILFLPLPPGTACLMPPPDKFSEASLTVGDLLTRTHLIKCTAALEHIAAGILQSVLSLNIPRINIPYGVAI